MKGFGYIEFKNSSTADTIVKTLRDTIIIGGRNVIIDYEPNPPKKSYKNNDGRALYKDTIKDNGKKGKDGEERKHHGRNSQRGGKSFHNRSRK